MPELAFLPVGKLLPLKENTASVPAVRRTADVACIAWDLTIPVCSGFLWFSSSFCCQVYQSHRQHQGGLERSFVKARCYGVQSFGGKKRWFKFTYLNVEAAHCVCGCGRHRCFWRLLSEDVISSPQRGQGHPLFPQYQGMLSLGRGLYLS